MYTLKQKPEDFIVREVSTVNPGKEGRYSYFILKKKNWTTVRAIEKIAGFLRIPLKDIGFAGTKDRIAVTEQMISIRRGHEKRLEGFDSKGIQLDFIGKGENPVSLGDLGGNEFEIIVREAEKIPKRLERFVNYFGEQRFSRNNVEIGRAIIKGNLKKAAGLIDFPVVKNYLKQKKNDYAGALKQVPRRILMLYVHAVSSYIWNRTAEEYLEGKKAEDMENFKIPVVGFGTEYESNKIEAIIRDILKKEKLTERDFIVRKMPELSAEGDERDLFADVKGLKIETLSSGTYKLSFFLGKGCYATELVRQIFS